MKIHLPPVLEVSNKSLALQTHKDSPAQHSYSQLESPAAEWREGIGSDSPGPVHPKPFSCQGGQAHRKMSAKQFEGENKQKTPLTATVCKHLSLEVLDSPQELLLWSFFMGPVQCDENMECSDGICNLELQGAQRQRGWGSTRLHFSSTRDTECETHLPQVSATTSLLSPPQAELLQKLQRGRAAPAPTRHSKDLLGFHLHIRVGNGFCLLSERKTPTKLKPEM